MKILEQLIDELGGEYIKEETKKGITPHGTYIYENSYGVLKKDNYTIKIYSNSSLGVRAANTLDKSPFKLVLIFPVIMKEKISLFPKSILKKILQLFSYNSFPDEQRLFLKSYDINASNLIKKLIMSNRFLITKIPKHKVYISSKKENQFSFLTLRPNESITTKEELMVIYKIIVEFGEILYSNKNRLGIL